MDCCHGVSIFCIDVTFEMRTVLSGIHLFTDKHKIVRQHFISNGNRGEECKIAVRQRERGCVRDSVWWKRRDSISHKMSWLRNTFGGIKMRLINWIST